MSGLPAAPGEPRPRVAWERRGAGGLRLGERLALYSDRSAWLWVQAAADPGRADRVGSFRAAVDGRRIQEAEALWAALAAAPDAAASVHGPEATVAGPDGSLLSLFAGQPGPGAALLALLDSLTAEAVRNPVAAARFVLARVPDTGVGGFALIVEGEGEQAVQFVLDPGAFVLSLSEANGEGERQGVGPLPIGLIGPDGDLVDGLHGTARLAPGSRAAAVLPVRAEAPRDARVEVGGRIALVGPWPAAPMAADAFEARTAVLPAGQPS